MNKSGFCEAQKHESKESVCFFLYYYQFYYISFCMRRVTVLWQFHAAQLLPNSVFCLLIWPIAAGGSLTCHTYGLMPTALCFLWFYLIFIYLYKATAKNKIYHIMSSLCALMPACSLLAWVVFPIAYRNGHIDCH